MAKRAPWAGEVLNFGAAALRLGQLADYREAEAIRFPLGEPGLPAELPPDSLWASATPPTVSAAATPHPCGATRYGSLRTTKRCTCSSGIYEHARIKDPGRIQLGLGGP